jgi:hypothetical protein
MRVDICVRTQAHTTPFCAAHDARVGPSLADLAERDDTPPRRLTRSASAGRMKKVVSAPALLPLPSAHDQPSDVSAPFEPSVSRATEALDAVTPGMTPGGDVGVTTVAPRTGGLRRVVSAAHLQSIANCRPEALDMSAHAQSPLRDDPQAPLTLGSPRRSGSKRTRLNSLQEMDEDEDHGGRPAPRATNASTESTSMNNIPIPVASARAPDVMTAIEVEEAAASEIAAAAQAAETREHDDTPVHEIFKRLLKGYHKRHQYSSTGSAIRPSARQPPTTG